MSSTPTTPTPFTRLMGAALPAFGAFLAILGTGLVTRAALSGPVVPLLVASMGASAVLMFCAAESPLAGWWPFVGGHVCSVLVGVAAAKAVPDLALAAALAVGGAILAMRLLGCVHPPGGAAALTAVVGGPAVTQARFHFLLVPVAVNLAVMAALVLAMRAAAAALKKRAPSRC